MSTHAALPVAQPTSRDEYRVYFSSRDGEGRAQIGFFEVVLAEPRKILRTSQAPVITFGPRGAFDESGVTSSWIVAFDHQYYQYYTGWTRGVTVPFYFYIGLAVSDDGGRTYQKVSASPVLDRDAVDPYLTASPCVLIENGIWRMWYVSGVRWEMKGDSSKHYYHIKYAESKDGIHWKRSGGVCIDFKSDDEHAIARPCVLKDGNGYKMWYSYRGKRYRIGYAESKDGLVWERKDDEAGIDVSASGWDAEMIEYAFVFDHGGDRYMLYNGNDYGRTGIGLAVLAEP